MVIMTRGPIHIIALIEDTSPMQIMAADDTAAECRRKCSVPAMRATSSCPD